MHDSIGPTTQTIPSKSRQFNFTKLQAVLCMAASAAVSVGLVVWAFLAWS